ncbi:MAG: prolyl oligopeptidase family protein [Vicinamibacteria bacterium]
MATRRALPLLAFLVTMNSTSPAAETAAPDDPYLWLEDVTGQKALAWVKEQNAQSVAELTVSDGFKVTDERFLRILDSEAKIPYVERLGDLYYNFWRDAAHERGIWRRTTLDDYRKAEPAWELVLDLDALGKAENESWVWHGAECLKPDYRRCLLALSRGGADADVTREFDLVTKAFVAGGFLRPEAKGSLGWIDADTVYVSTDFGPGSMTSSGYPRIVKEWRRATSLDKAQVVYEGKADDISVGAFRDHTPGYERDFVYRAPTFFTSELYLRRGGALLKIDKPDDAQLSVHRDLLLLTLRSDWTVGGRTYRAGSLLAADFEAFLKGSRDLDVLFEPTERVSLAGFSPTLHHILLNELDNVRSRVHVLTRTDGVWRREPLPSIPDFGSVDASAVDGDRSDDFFLTADDFLTPTSLSLGNAGGGAAAERLKTLPSFFEAGGLTIAQHEAVSKDGTRIPYFEVSRKGPSRDGQNPTLLYGYGGFEISMTPDYGALNGAGWLERGGVYALANIRGGGEFGPAWHHAALKEKRHKAYEDFVAVAEDLIVRKVTSKPHLGIMGGSNGGLLVGNMLTMRPDLFGAVVCQVPLLDMKRYSHLLAGASWMEEYGDPDDPAQWEFLKAFSPYLNVAKGTRYPRTLFTTSTRDDRVHPGHARKMVAKMKAQGHDVLYYENTEGGHGGAANNAQAAFMWALAYTFLWNQLR